MKGAHVKASADSERLALEDLSREELLVLIQERNQQIRYSQADLWWARYRAATDKAKALMEQSLKMRGDGVHPHSKRWSDGREMFDRALKISAKADEFFAAYWKKS